jgi:hypothetical protein
MHEFTRKKKPAAMRAAATNQDSMVVQDNA